MPNWLRAIHKTPSIPLQSILEVIILRSSQLILTQRRPRNPPRVPRKCIHHQKVAQILILHNPLQLPLQLKRLPLIKIIIRFIRVFSRNARLLFRNARLFFLLDDFLSECDGVSLCTAFGVTGVAKCFGFLPLFAPFGVSTARSSSSNFG